MKLPQRFERLSVKRMLISLISILILNSCASEPKLNVKWFFLDGPDGKPAACLSEDDLIQVKTALIFCEAKQ